MFVALIPIFNDWKTASQLLESLDRALVEHRLAGRAVLIDDGSSDAPSEDGFPGALAALSDIQLLRLRRNLGHQRALAIGLAWIAEHLPDHDVVIMDGDGEDAPEDVPRLLRKMTEERGDKVVFAARTLRAEGVVFRAGYLAYRLLHRLLTGKGIRFGNFSAIPASVVSRLSVVSELWNHYAAAVCKSRIPFATIPARRRKRISGDSKMSFSTLVVHGLSALSVHGEIIGVRLLIGSSVACLMLLGALAGLLIVGQPGAVNRAGLLLIGMLQVVSLSFFFSFLTLHSRASTGFIPLRDYAYFVLGVLRLARPRLASQGEGF